MRIGINASFLRKPGTGIGQVTLYFLKTLSQGRQGKAHDFFLYLDADANTAFFPGNFHKKVFLPLWKRDDLIRKILWEKQIGNEAVKDGCDVFLSLYQSSSIVPKKMPHTMVVHDIIPRLFPEYQRTLRQAWYWKRVEKGIRKADRIVAISEHTKNDLVRELLIPENNISVAYLDVAPSFRQSVSPEAVSAILKKYDLPAGYIYHGGGLEIRKNTEKLLRVYKELTINKQQTSKGVPNLVISGKIFDKTNKLATDVEGLTRELQLQDKVRLLGFVPEEDLPALYRGALFFVYPSLYEGFGLPVLEALCQGVPVLSSNSSSLPEVGGKAVLYVDPTDIQALADQMKRLLTDERLRAALISESASQIAKFSWEYFVQKTLATLKQ